MSFTTFDFDQDSALALYVCVQDLLSTLAVWIDFLLDLFLVAINPTRICLSTQMRSFNKIVISDEMRTLLSFSKSRNGHESIWEEGENKSVLITLVAFFVSFGISLLLNLELGENPEPETESSKKVIQYLAAMRQTSTHPHRVLHRHCYQIRPPLSPLDPRSRSAACLPLPSQLLRVLLMSSH